MTGRLQVVLTPRAFADLTHIRDYLIERSPTGADNVRQAINSTFDHLSDHPGLGRDRPELGVRSVGVPRYSYTIYYRIAETQSRSRTCATIAANRSHRAISEPKIAQVR